MRIQRYRFGEIIIDNKKYNSDLIIYPDRVKSNWWRKTGHELCLSDIKEVIEFNPEIIVIGTGANGIMRVLDETEKVIKEKKIELIILKTDQACNIFNELMMKNKKIVACLHLTC